MAKKKKNVDRCYEMYKAMYKAVPDDSKMWETIRACEYFIADCLAQSNVGKEAEEGIYKRIVDDIRKFTEIFTEGYKLTAEEVARED